MDQNAYVLLASVLERKTSNVTKLYLASTHVCEEVIKLNEDQGSCLLYTAPHSPNSSPIECGFNAHESYFKRNARNYGLGKWFHLHVEAYRAMSRDILTKEFRKCNMPKSYDVLTSNDIRDKISKIETMN